MSDWCPLGIKKVSEDYGESVQRGSLESVNILRDQKFFGTEHFIDRTVFSYPIYLNPKFVWTQRFLVLHIFGTENF